MKDLFPIGTLVEWTKPNHQVDLGTRGYIISHMGEGYAVEGRHESGAKWGGYWEHKSCKAVE